MGTGADIANSIIGNTEAAYLVVNDYRKCCDETNLTPESRKAAMEKRYFRVQFNPKELQLNGTVTHEEKKDAQATTSGKSTVSEANLKPSVTLSVNLYFDDTNRSDAFLGERLTSGVSATTATNIASGIMAAAGKKWSVQPQIEALIAALRNDYTRDITFHWADFSFSGQLTAVTTQYTMFSLAGRPIRAMVALRIMQEQDPENLNTWYSNFSSSFGGGDQKSLTGAAQKVGNLFNINL